MELCSLVCMHVPQWALLGSYLLDKHIIQVYPYLSPIHAPIYTFTLSVAVCFMVSLLRQGARAQSEKWNHLKHHQRGNLQKMRFQNAGASFVMWLAIKMEPGYMHVMEWRTKKTRYRIRLSGIYCTAVPFFKGYTIRHIIKSIVMLLKSGLIKVFYSITNCYCLF